MEFGAQISRGGSAGIWAFRVGSRCEHFGQRELLKILPGLNGAQLRWLIQRIDRIEKSRRPLADVLRKEKWANQVSITELYSDKRWPQFLADKIVGGCVPVADLQGIVRVRLTGKGGLIREYSHALDSAILESAQPYKKRQWRNNSSDVTYGLQPDFKNAAFIDALPRARTRSLETVAALRLYRLRTGRYPAKLSTLVPRYLKHVPLDPYEEPHSLRYKPSASKYVLYSIGPDGKDDNAKLLKSDGTILGHSADSKGDIVAINY
jgi:hypothetical protein